MNLDQALKGVFDAENSLRTPRGVIDPSVMSLQMIRLSQYLGAVEEKLAEYERDLDIQSATILKEYLIDKKMKVTQAERLLDIEISELKGQIKYLNRIVASGWKQTGVVQSRINHLIKQSESTNL